MLGDTLKKGWLFERACPNAGANEKRRQTGRTGVFHKRRFTFGKRLIARNCKRVRCGKIWTSL